VKVQFELKLFNVDKIIKKRKTHKKEFWKNGRNDGGVMKLHHAALISSSEANADKFYEGTLKLRKIKTSLLKNDLSSKIFKIDVECLMILYGNEDFAIEVFVTDRIPNEELSLRHLCLEVGEREKFLERCRSNGIEINLVPRGDSQICFVQDFDGNLFEVK